MTTNDLNREFAGLLKKFLLGSTTKTNYYYTFETGLRNAFKIEHSRCVSTLCSVRVGEKING